MLYAGKRNSSRRCDRWCIARSNGGNTIASPVIGIRFTLVGTLETWAAKCSADYARCAWISVANRCSWDQVKRCVCVKILMSDVYISNNVIIFSCEPCVSQDRKLFPFFSSNRSEYIPTFRFVCLTKDYVYLFPLSRKETMSLLPILWLRVITLNQIARQGFISVV